MKKVMFLFLVMAIVSPPIYAQGIPLMINYQGKVEVNGVPFDGAGDFKFALTNQAGDTYYWTNDGSTPTPPNAPTNAVSLNVTGGSYSVVLGDASLSNMTTVPASLFTAPGIFLRVWFDDGSIGEQLLLPDKQLTSVPYAYMAEKVAPLSITGENLALESVWPEHEGRSNTVVSRYATFTAPAGGGTWDLEDPVPPNKTYVITDVFFSGWRDNLKQVLILWDDGAVEKILLGFHYEAAMQNSASDWGFTRSPYVFSFKAGIPVPGGAHLKVRIIDGGSGGLSNAHCMVSGYEFQNN